ncbi:MAG: aromatic amino acid ammonia-lyase, partial [Pseudomonadota bacterium]
HHNRFVGNEAFEKFPITKLELESRAGLALVNGTSAMTGIAALNVVRFDAALEIALRSASAYGDIMKMRIEATDPSLQALRPHRGQLQAANNIRQLLKGSKRVNGGFIADNGNDEPEKFFAQDPYTLRCLPQLFGALIDMAAMHRTLIETELNAVTDNPVVVDEEPFALHGGNFYGQHVGFASDALIAPVIKLGVLLERQLARLTDPVFNKGLPAFLQPRQSGLNSGFMGAQVTASALVAEMRSVAVPASMQAVPTNGNNQDVNTMGTVAARKISALLDDAFSILAIHALAIAQAVDLLEDEGGFATETIALRDRVRKKSTFLAADRPLSNDIQSVAEAFDPVTAC